MIPAPGSEQAQALGCTCPVIDTFVTRYEFGSIISMRNHGCCMHGKRGYKRRRIGIAFENFPHAMRYESSETWDVVAELFTQE